MPVAVVADAMGMGGRSSLAIAVVHSRWTVDA